MFKIGFAIVDLTFLLTMVAAMVVAVSGALFYQLSWKERRRREMERRHHSNKRRSIS